MYIEPKSKIAGVSALNLRNFFRKAGDGSWRVEFLQAQLGVSLSDANPIISQLTELGYIEPDECSEEDEAWRVTANGNRLALATAAKPIRRSTADKKLKEFMERIKHVNESDAFLYKVKKVGIFGSYLTDKDFINDIDIALLLEPKEADMDKLQLLIWKKTSEAIEKGRNFSNFSEKLFWPQIEVVHFLKARSRVLSLQLLNEESFESLDKKVAYYACWQSRNQEPVRKCRRRGS